MRVIDIEIDGRAEMTGLQVLEAVLQSWWSQRRYRRDGFLVVRPGRWPWSIEFALTSQPCGLVWARVTDKTTLEHVRTALILSAANAAFMTLARFDESPQQEGENGV